MKKFLEQVAGAFAGRDDLEETCFVFPSRRAALFFGRYLGIAAGRAVVAPPMLTIDDLFRELSDLEPADKIELLYGLFQSYVDVKAELSEDASADTFDEFVYWGDILLRDFDDIDKYLVRADKLLVNVKELKDLSIDYDFLSPAQKKAIAEFCGNFKPENEPVPGGKRHMFNETWNLLLPLYQKFRASLSKDGKCWPGMMYRHVAERAELSSELSRRYRKLVFVGLSALNECEKKLLSAARDAGIADFYWDFDGRLVTDPECSAARFVKDNVKLFRSSTAFSGTLGNHVPDVTVIGVPSAVGQTRVAMSIMENLRSEGNMDDPFDTAVILPDESLLFPMLGAVPEAVREVNVTMGYPMSAGSVAGFFSLLERLQSNARVREGRVCFYHTDVIGVLEHNFFRSSEFRETISGLKKEIVRKNSIFVEAETLAGAGPVFAGIFRRIEKTPDIPDYQLSVIESIQPVVDGTQREFLLHYYGMVQKIKKMNPGLNEMLPKTYYKLLSQCTSLISIPFSGEPLGGLQIMGPLETRSLDFKNVIFLSMNEGTFPSRSVSASFIPYNLRRGFGLPTYERQDSVWSYHFYRSICRAEKVFLLFDSRAEGLNSGEVSRYVMQLKYHFRLPVRERSAAFKPDSSAISDEDMVVEKDEAVMAELEAHFVGGKGRFSASSLNDYLDCPLRYYYRHVKGFREEDDVVEELDAGLFGTIYHSVMENLYRPFKGKVVNGCDIDSMLREQGRIENLIVASFERDAHIREIEGQNIILKQVIRKYVVRTLAVDREQAPFTLLDTERKVSLPVEIAGGREVMLYGKIDRLDRREAGTVRVVDYKTGSVNKRDNCNDVEKIFDNSGSTRPDIALQLYFYAMLMNGQPDAGDTVYAPCIYSLRSIFGDVPGSHRIEPENLALFKERVIALISEIFDSNIPFAGRGSLTGGEVCKYCDFKKLCRKQ